MSATLAIIAALPSEVAALVRGTRADPTLSRDGVHLYRLPQAIVVAAGMGSSRASLAVQAALAVAPIATLISAGLAGACTDALPVGTVAEAGIVIAANTGERFTAATSQPRVLVTTDAIASVQEKRRLAATYNAALVDMEAATVARLAVAHGLRFRAIKAVSDAHDFELADFNRFATNRGEFRTAAFALHTALRPATWSKAAQLGRNGNLALQALHARLAEVIAEQPLP